MTAELLKPQSITVVRMPAKTMDGLISNPREKLKGNDG